MIIFSFHILSGFLFLILDRKRVLVHFYLCVFVFVQYVLFYLALFFQDYDMCLLLFIDFLRFCFYFIMPKTMPL